jgi:hypothetical protein
VTRRPTGIHGPGRNTPLRDIVTGDHVLFCADVCAVRATGRSAKGRLELDLERTLSRGSTFKAFASTCVLLATPEEL